jgi:carbonic anhydrase
VDGSLFARDMHLVRRKKGASDLNGLLVIGIMYDMGQAIDLLSRMGLPSGAPEPGVKLLVPNSIDLVSERCAAMDGGFYRYDGSLTAPPCSLTVKWIVIRAHLTLSQAQVDSFATVCGQDIDIVVLLVVQRYGVMCYRRVGPYSIRDAQAPCSPPLFDVRMDTIEKEGSASL